jgi:hypothetical protein
MQTDQIRAARKEFPDMNTQLDPVQVDTDKSGQKNQGQKNLRDRGESDAFFCP